MVVFTHHVHTDAGGTNFIIRNCGVHTKIEKEDVCIHGHGQSVN